MNFAKTKDRVVTKTFEHSYYLPDGEKETESVTFSFYEKCLTPAFFDAIGLFEETRNASEIAKHLSKNITSWDLDWNSEPFPPSYDNLTNVCDFEFVMELVNEMSGSFMGNEQKRPQSLNGSGRSAKSKTLKAAR